MSNAELKYLKLEQSSRNSGGGGKFFQNIVYIILFGGVMLFVGQHMINKLQEKQVEQTFAAAGQTEILNKAKHMKSEAELKRFAEQEANRIVLQNKGGRANLETDDIQKQIDGLLAQ